MARAKRRDGGDSLMQARAPAKPGEGPLVLAAIEAGNWPPQAELEALARRAIKAAEAALADVAALSASRSASAAKTRAEAEPATRKGKSHE